MKNQNNESITEVLNLSRTILDLAPKTYLLVLCLYHKASSPQPLVSSESVSQDFVVFASVSQESHNSRVLSGFQVQAAKKDVTSALTSGDFV